MAELSLVEFVAKTLRASNNIPNFRYWGPLRLGKHWAFTFSLVRDFSLLALSNFESIEADLAERFPHDVEIVRVSHFVLGWVQYITVRMTHEDGDPTDAAEAIHEWVRRLANHPVADDADLARREYDAAIEGLRSYVNGELKSNMPEDWRDRVLHRMDYMYVLDDGSLEFSHDPTVIAAELGFLTGDSGL